MQTTREQYITETFTALIAATEACNPDNLPNWPRQEMLDYYFKKACDMADRLEQSSVAPWFYTTKKADTSCSKSVLQARQRLWQAYQMQPMTKQLAVVRDVFCQTTGFSETRTDSTADYFWTQFKKVMQENNA